MLIKSKLSFYLHCAFSLKSTGHLDFRKMDNKAMKNKQIIIMPQLLLY